MSDWLTYSPTSGHGNGTITLTASSISDLDYRMETLVARNSQHSLSAATIVEQRIPPTSITFDSLSVVWVYDIPSSGGVATKSNCEYRIYANYSDGSQEDVTNLAEVSGSLVVPQTTAIIRHYAGQLQLTAVYEGRETTIGVDAYQQPIDSTDYVNMYFTIDVKESGTIVINSQGLAEYPDYAMRLYYRSNDKDWNYFVFTNNSQLTLHVVSGEKIQFKSVCSYFIDSYRTYYAAFDGNGTAKFEVKGNILSLEYGDNFTNKDVLDLNFLHLLSGSKVLSAENLVLPATKINENCGYGYMFAWCTLLKKSPQVLPATTLSEGCYDCMFFYCLTLETTPSLPATTLAEGCYSSMFFECRSIIDAPILPATTLVYRCYLNMFGYCYSLRFVKCLATDISASECTKNWVYEVPSTGTFVKSPSMTGWTTGVNGVPSGWTVINNS